MGLSALKATFKEAGLTEDSVSDTLNSVQEVNVYQVYTVIWLISMTGVIIVLNVKGMCSEPSLCMTSPLWNSDHRVGNEE